MFVCVNMSESIIFTHVPIESSSKQCLSNLQTSQPAEAREGPGAVMLTCFNSLFVPNPWSVMDDTCKLSSTTQLYSCWLAWMFYIFKAALRPHTPLHAFQMASISEGFRV